MDAGDSIPVNGEGVRAFESGLSYEIDTIDSLTGSFACRRTSVSCQGSGYVAITIHGNPLGLDPQSATGPSATVAWSGTSPDVAVNGSLSDTVGQESGERFRLNFGGRDGFVVFQPSEGL